MKRGFGFAGRHFPNENNFNPAAISTKLTQQAQQDLVRCDIREQAGKALDSFAFVVIRCCNFGPCFRKSLIIKMERAKGFEPSTLTLAT